MCSWAHHLIPWASRTKTVVQKEVKANSQFYMNEALNGVAVAAWRNQPNHNTYNALIKTKLDNIPTNLSPNQTYQQMITILNQAKQAIINNPNVHLNNITF